MLMWLLRAWNCHPVHGVLDVWTTDLKCLDVLLRRQWTVSSQTWIATSEISWHSQRCLIGFRNGELGDQSMVSAFILHEWLMTLVGVSHRCHACHRYTVPALITEENRVDASGKSSGVANRAAQCHCCGALVPCRTMSTTCAKPVEL